MRQSAGRVSLYAWRFSLTHTIFETQKLMMIIFYKVSFVVHPKLKEANAWHKAEAFLSAGSIVPA
jgi:hypothetical protein